MRKLKSLNESLYSAFAQYDLCDPQDKSIMWAILEGLRRLQTIESYWRYVDARKEHECIRGCIIPKESVYFHYSFASWAWDDDLKICARCMAMILYFKKVGEMPHGGCTHWDIEAEKSILLPPAFP